MKTADNWLRALPAGTGVLITNRRFQILSTVGTAVDWPSENGILEEREVCILKKAMQQRPYFHAGVKIEYVPWPENDALVFWFRDWNEIEDMQRKLHCCNAILDSINEGVIATNKEGEIIVYNKQLAEFEGMDQAEVLGKHLIDVYQWSVEGSEHMQVLRTGEPIKEGNYQTVTRLGKQNQLVATTLPIFEDGEVVAAYSISRNVTKIRDIYNKTIELQPRMTKNNVQHANGTRFTFEDLIFISDKMKKLVIDSEKAALSPSPVLIYGETGTGKEIIAQSIHNAGKNREQPFIGINCAAIPESLLESLLFGTVKGAFTGAENTAGFFEQAKEGAIYLDEINSMPLNLQAKLLRVIQEKAFRRIGGTAEMPLRCKVLASVNMDPLDCVLEGGLRQDLYYRLSVITLSIPPLRERLEDIKPLLDYFTKKYKEVYGDKEVKLSGDIAEMLKGYHWPGNVRELEHIIERAISLMDEGGELTRYHLPPYLREKLNQKSYKRYRTDADHPLSLQEALLETEKEVILEALKASGGNITKAAASLGIGRQNLQYRMRKLDIHTRK